MAIKPVTVTQLNGYIKRVLQSDPLLSSVSVIGEVSNLKFHESGHVYFSMKDGASKINCFLPADRVKDLRYELADGMEVTAAGFIYIYEKGGTYSLNVRDIEISGQGDLATAFDQLKKKLQNEGIFDRAAKKPLPDFPKKIAIVTSGTGAALEDMLKIIRSRNNIVDILVYPVLVQGPGAAKEIARGINDINDKFPETDIIITGRGGGSIEELWAFNEEIVARSIFGSVIPVISAVGHETDVTISDFAADVRAETPTAAAHMAVPDVSELKKHIMSLKSELSRSIDRYLENKARMLEIQKVKLDSLSPANIMAMGYGAVLDKNGYFKSTVAAFSPGDQLTVVFADGEADCSVKEIRGKRYGNR